MTEVHSTDSEFERMLDQASLDAKRQISKEEVQGRVRIIVETFKENKQEAIMRIVELILDCLEIKSSMEQDEIYIYDKGVYHPNGDRILGIFLEQKLGLGPVLKTHIINEVVGHVKRKTMQSKLKEENNKLCLENGILHLETMEITRHSPEYFFINKLPVKYSPERDCPKIKEFLKQVVGEEQINLIQEIVGYTLYKGYPIHKAIMFIGTGKNGKSTLINLIREFIGQDNCSSMPLHNLENHRFAASSLHGKLVNMFADLPARALKETSMFKMLTGEDLIPGEKKFKNHYSFKNYAKLLFSCNRIPRSPDDSDAFFRRWVIVNFPNQFLNNADTQLIKKLTTSEELSGFLNFALEGLTRLLKKQDFSNTRSIEDVRDQYIRMSDSVKAFINDCIEVSSDGHEPKKSLYTSYCDYCRERKYPIEAENTFHRFLQHEIRVEDYRPTKFIEGEKKRVQCWKGIKLNQKNINSDKNPDNPDNGDDVNLVSDNSYFNSKNLEDKEND